MGERATTVIINPWEVDLDLIEPHPFWQVEQGSPFHQDLTLSRKTVCERFFWERLYHHLAISSSKRGVNPRSGQQPLRRAFTTLAWKRRLLHVFDRGFAGGPWIGKCLERSLRFLIRWPKDYKLRDGQGNKRNAWHITRGKRSWAQRQVWDGRRKNGFRLECWLAVRHPDYEQALWLVVSRPGRGQSPWYLLTTEPIATEQDAWNIVFAYARRCQRCDHRD